MRDSEFGSPLRAIVRLSIYVLATLLAMPVQLVALGFKLPLRRSFPRWYHRRCCRLLGFRIERRGRLSRIAPTLFVSNHVSYFDIMALSALLEASFVAKREVANWPFFGLLAKLQRTVFIDRRSQRQVAGQRDAIGARLEEGDNLILFPEGTSGDGSRVLPFKSALFAVAEREVRGQPLTLQPVSITYTRLDGMPMGRYLRPFFAWYGDMDLIGHLWRAVGLGRVTVVVEFHPTITLAEAGSRKALAERCQAAV
ncbi:MAG: lysophospholipid acyltransferase family protein, partial [Kiloniellales bacterium]